MLLKILGTKAFVSDEHSVKASSPISVTLFGMTTVLTLCNKH